MYFETNGQTPKCAFFQQFALNGLRQNEWKVVFLKTKEFVSITQIQFFEIFALALMLEFLL